MISTESQPFSLLEYTERLITLHAQKSSSIDPQLLASFANQLISAEVSVGGPYSEVGVDTLHLNTRIYELCESLHISLPNLTAYLAAHGLAISPRIHTPTQNTYTVTAQLVKKELETFPGNIQKELRSIWQRVAQNDATFYISDITRLFTESLKSQYLLSDSNENLPLLQKANFYTWMTYTLYDDVIDGDALTQSVSIANILSRRSYQLYEEASVDLALLNDLFDSVDMAQYKEASHLHADDSILAEKGIVHILGCLHVSQSRAFTQKQRHAIHKALSFYIAARQLNDDIHDWKSDFASNRTTYATKILIAIARQEDPQHTPTAQDLQPIFWRVGLEALCGKVISYITEAESLLKSTNCFTENTDFFSMITLPKKSALQAITVHKRNKQFITSFAKAPHL